MSHGRMDRKGRYMRIRLSGNEPVSLAEVQVYGTCGSR
jgi:hypothetical protein